MSEERNLIVVGATEEAWTARQKQNVRQNLYERREEIMSFYEVGSGESDKGGVDIWFKEMIPDPLNIDYIPFYPNFSLYGRPTAYHVRNAEMSAWGDVFWGYLPVGYRLLRSGTMQTIRNADKREKETHVYYVYDRPYDGRAIIEIEDRGTKK